MLNGAFRATHVEANLRISERVWAFSAVGSAGQAPKNSNFSIALAIQFPHKDDGGSSTLVRFVMI